MGIYNRDYVRHTDRYGGGTSADGTGWKRLIAITIGVFILQILTTRRGGGVSLVQQWLELDPELVLQGQVWRLLTYAFCHTNQDLFHILFNMLWIWYFGSTLEGIYGTREFVLFYLSAALFAGLVFLGFGLWMHDPAHVVGASGAVLGTVMLMALHFPRQQLLILGLFPIEMRWMVLLIVVADSIPVLRDLQGADLRSTTAHTAHLWGLAFGYLYFARQWRIEPLFGRGFGRRLRSAFQRRPKNIRVYEPPSQEPASRLDAQVDSILAKIHEKGEASLTDNERETLRKASQRYKNR